MRNLAIVCLLIGSLNVGYGQEATSAAKAKHTCNPRISGTSSPTEIPFLSKVPHHGRLFQAAPPAASSYATAPCFPTTRPVSVPRAMATPTVARLPATHDHRLTHLLRAAEHLAAAGEAEQAQRVQQLAGQEGEKLLAQLKALRAEVADLRRPDERQAQILVKLKLVELSRTKARAFGLDFSTLDAAVGRKPESGTCGFTVVGDASPLFNLLEALQKDRLAKVLAEPTLVTMSGRPASLSIVTEVPVLVPQDDGSQKLEHREYGTRVDLLAIDLGEGRVRLEIHPRISQLDAANSTPGNPAISVREIDTSVELKFGQTFVVGGLVQTQVTTGQSEIPWLSEIPYLGEMFAVTEPQQEEIELLLLVTPELVEAMEVPEFPQSGPVGPTVRIGSPRDKELYFYNRSEAPLWNPNPRHGAADRPQGRSNPIATRPSPQEDVKPK